MSIAVLLAVGLLELVVRLAPGAVGFDAKTYGKLSAFARGDNPGFYEGWPHTIYRLKQQPGVNSLGFSDHEWTLEKPAGVHRVACLGASTTQDGIGVDRPSYPRQLEGILSERLGCSIETLNFGIDGWTSAETATNYFLNVADYKPDVVVIQHALNDVWARMWPDYRTDYSHYRTPYQKVQFGPIDGFLFLHWRTYAFVRLKNWGPNDLTSRNTKPITNRRQVLRQAQLVPETMRGYRENIESIIAHAGANGARVFLVTIKTNPRGAEHIMKNQPELIAKLVEGTDQHNELLREIARDTPAILVDIAKEWEDEGFEDKHLPNYTDGFVHVNPKGNRDKARRIADVILQAQAIACE